MTDIESTVTKGFWCEQYCAIEPGDEWYILDTSGKQRL